MALFEAVVCALIYLTKLIEMPARSIYCYCFERYNLDATATRLDVVTKESLNKPRQKNFSTAQIVKELSWSVRYSETN